MTKAVKKKKEVINFNTNKSDKKNTNKGVKDKFLSVVCSRSGSGISDRFVFRSCLLK